MKEKSRAQRLRDRERERESRDRQQKRAHSFSLTVSTEIHKQMAKYKRWDSEIQPSNREDETLNIGSD